MIRRRPPRQAGGRLDCAGPGHRGLAAGNRGFAAGIHAFATGSRAIGIASHAGTDQQRDCAAHR